MSEHQDPGRPEQRPTPPERVTPPEWETTEFPAFTAYPDQNHPGQSYPGQSYPGQAYPGQSYPDHNYPGENYPDQGYPGQSYPGQTFPGRVGCPPAPWDQVAAPPKRRTALWVVAAVVVVAALVTGGVLLFPGGTIGSKKAEASNTLGRSIVLPASAAGYKQVTGFPTAALTQQLGTALSGSGASNVNTDNAKIGIYSRGGSTVPGIIFVALALKDVPKLDQQVSSTGIDAAVRQFVTGASQTSSGAAPVSFPPGRLSGAMYCASATISVESVVNCGWGDRSYFALTIVVDPASTASAAATTRAFRAAAEH